jgi:fructuronate reductase
MLVEESVPTLGPVPGIVPLAYVDESLARLRNTAIRHRCHQIATDGSQKLVQRLINPAAERVRRGERIDRIAVAIAAWMAYLLRASDRFGRAWAADDPQAARIAAIADRVGDDPAALAAGILGVDAVFDPDLAAREEFRAPIVAALGGLLADDPMAVVRRALDPITAEERT